MSRYQRAEVGGATYWFVATSQGDAAKILADHCSHEIDEGAMPEWSTMTVADAAKITTRTDSAHTGIIRRPLTECELGAWFCSEYD